VEASSSVFQFLERVDIKDLCQDQGNAYLIDVTSVRGLDSSPAQLSEREKRVAEKAKKAGFKVLVPVVRFLSDWRVLIELVEA